MTTVSFPNSFAERVETLETGIGQRGDAALERMRAKGFTVATGLTEYYAGAIRPLTVQYLIVDCTWPILASY